MARTQNTLFGRTSGSIGGVTCQTWKGVNIVRSKPFEVRQNVTPSVQLNRNKFAMVGRCISRINYAMSVMYNFGIQKTTEYADTVKFFRDKVLDTLKLDPTLLAGAKFGTGNAEGFQYELGSDAVDAFVIERIANSGDAEFDSADTEVSVLVVNDTMTKIGWFPNVAAGNALTITLDLSTYDFASGDKVKVATKNIKFKAGADLAGKVKFSDIPTFTTLTT